MKQMIEKVRNLLKENGIWAEVDQHLGLPVIEVAIEMGDWKHEHGRTRYLLTKELGLHYLGYEVTEETEEDVYSAIHRFIANIH